MAESNSHKENTDEQLRLVRFFLGAKLLGQTRLVLGDTVVEHAESAGVNVPTNCISGTVYMLSYPSCWNDRTARSTTARS